MAIDLGDQYRLAYTHTINGALVNATTMTVSITLPDQTVVSGGTVTPDSTGQYHYDYVTTQAGRHTFRWVGTGTNPGAQPGEFNVREAAPPYIISLDDLKDQLNMTTSVSDEELRIYLEAATGLIEEYLSKAVVRRVITAEEHTARAGCVTLNWAPVMSLTSLARVDGTYTWPTSSVHVNANTGVIYPLPSGLAITGQVTVAYVAGMQIVPAKYGLAAAVTVQDLWQSQRGSGGVARPGLDAPVVRRGYALSYQAREMLGTPRVLIA